MGHVVGHFFRRDADPGTALLEGAEQISPEGDQIVLLLGHHALAFHGGGASLAVPEGLVVVAGVLTLDQAGGQGLGGGFTIDRAQTGGDTAVCRCATAEMP